VTDVSPDSPFPATLFPPMPGAPAAPAPQAPAPGLPLPPMGAPAAPPVEAPPAQSAPLAPGAVATGKVHDGAINGPQPSSLEAIVKIAHANNFSDIHLGVGEEPRYRARGEMLRTGWPITDHTTFHGWLR